MGRRIFFAVDNVDFAEDTSDGKCTQHATATVINQRRQHGDEVSKLELIAHSHSMKELPRTVSKLLHFHKP